ncbi:HAMP domain-containing sensor histidine kinase [Paludisphaera sp.]|uniref:sensor histidine kinase n=1 Tax=Paludisphaera sp. TaxID=2017432 RepID=UPI00301E141F
MSLASRLLLYFLGTLAGILVVFSATMYGLGWTYLHHRLDSRLEKTLAVLEAAVHFEPDGLEWKPRERRLNIGVDHGIDEIRWAIRDKAGELVDRSANWAGGEGEPAPAATWTAGRNAHVEYGDAGDWRQARSRLILSEMVHPRKAPPPDDLDDDEYDELTLIAALSREPVDASIAWLGMALGVASLATWLLCAAIGRRLCRRALGPITALADSAREKARADDEDVLPVPETGDELEELGRSFNALLDRRREALERQRRFSGDASHQLRTPIAGVLSLIDVVRRRPRPAEDYEQALDQVRAEAVRLHRIVESLLFLARAESEAEPLSHEPIDLVAWLPGLLLRWEGRPRAADLRFVAESTSAWARVHPPLLAQAVENLVDNALKYSEPGSPVTVRLRREPGASAVSVEDRGCGLTGEEREAAFEPFYQSPRARLLGRGGVGLGLSVVRRVVRASRGTIQVESAPGAGSRFTIRLPEAPAPEPVLA